jgi:hypothetical protein
MGIKKFIQNVLESLNITDFEITSKKRSLKNLITKLKKKRVELLKELQEELSQKRVEELTQELQLIDFHIKKGKNKLEELKKS